MLVAHIQRFGRFKRGFSCIYLGADCAAFGAADGCDGCAFGNFRSNSDMDVHDRPVQRRRDDALGVDGDRHATRQQEIDAAATFDLRKLHAGGRRIGGLQRDKAFDMLCLVFIRVRIGWCGRGRFGCACDDKAGTGGSQDGDDNAHMGALNGHGKTRRI